MASKGVVLGIGRLLSLEILDPKTGRTRKQTIRGKWLAWMPKKRAYCIVRVLGRHTGFASIGTGQGTVANALKNIRAAHAKFHQAPPKNVVKVDVPEARGALQHIGLVKALVYDVPRGSIRSPGKNPYHWHHAFGDVGHQGGGDYPTKVMPALVRDRAGNLFIKRRPGNIFTVDTWLRG